MNLDKLLAYITKGLLLATFIIPPFVAPWVIGGGVIGGKLAIGSSLFFPFVSGRVYTFRLLVEISLFFWLLLVARRPEFRPRLKNPIILGALLFLAGLIITAFFGVDPAHSFFSNIERSDGIVQFGHWVLFLLMISSVFRRPKEWRVFLWIFAGVAAAVALYAWSLHFLPETNRFHEGRIAGLFNNPSYLAAFMIFAIGMTSLLWGLSASRKNKPVSLWRHLIFGGLVLFFVATLVQTGTRGAYLGFVVGLTLLALLSAIFLRQTNRRLVLVAGGLAIVTLLGVGSIFVFKESNFVKNNDILNHIAVLSEFGDVGSVRERYVNWQVALEAFRDKPVFGWGPENYDIAFNAHYNYLAGKDEPWFDSSHSQLFDTLAETGIFGFSLYLFWIGAVFYVALKLLRGDRPRDKLIGAVLASTYLAFLTQGWFLFDTFPMYLGLFPFLGFAYFKYERINGANSKEQAANSGKVVPATWTYGLALILILLIP
ncbi:MAG: O-antigen ligase family protein, partial [Candidatus Colwellbacteria bacterium]|nr:O-antigen ligase family protein [Candidatus Colwellbacteria bacterium]